MRGASAKLIVHHDGSVGVIIYPVSLPPEENAVQLKAVQSAFRLYLQSRALGDTPLNFILQGRHRKQLAHEIFLMPREPRVRVERGITFVFKTAPVFHHISLQRELRLCRFGLDGLLPYTVGERSRNARVIQLGARPFKTHTALAPVEIWADVPCIDVTDAHDGFSLFIGASLRYLLRWGGAYRRADYLRLRKPRAVSVRKRRVKRVADLPRLTPAPFRVPPLKQRSNKLRLGYGVFARIGQRAGDDQALSTRSEQAAEDGLLLLALFAYLRQMGMLIILRRTGVEPHLVIIAQQQRFPQHPRPAVVIDASHQPVAMLRQYRRHPRVQRQRVALRQLYRQRGGTAPVVDEGNRLAAAQHHPRRRADVFRLVVKVFYLFFELIEGVGNILHPLVKRRFAGGDAYRAADYIGPL